MNIEELTFRFYEVLTSIYRDLMNNKQNEAFIRLGAAFSELEMLMKQIEETPGSKSRSINPIQIKSIFDKGEDDKNG